MSSARMAAPLWRTTGRCLVLGPRAMSTSTSAVTPLVQRTAAVRPVATTEAMAAASARARPTLLAVRPAAAVRGYADDATTSNTTRGPGSSTESDDAAACSLPATPPPRPIAGNGAGFGTSTGASMDMAAESADDTLSTPENREALRQLELLSRGLAPFDPATDGHKFGLTTATTRAATAAWDAVDGHGDGTGSTALGQNLPMAPKLQDRYHPVIQQLTRLLMRDGKLSKAQRDMAMILNYLRTSPPPKLDPAHPLLPGHMPAAQMPLDPIGYLTLAIDSVAPLIKIKSLAGAAGGGRALPVPMPLAARQRRRTAFMWLLELVNKRPSRTSGRAMFPHRVAEEVVAIVEGRSSLWAKRQLLHRMGTASRINVNALRKR